MAKLSETLWCGAATQKRKSIGRKAKWSKRKMSRKKDLLENNGRVQGRMETVIPINWISGILRESENNQSSQLTNPKGFFTA